MFKSEVNKRVWLLLLAMTIFFGFNFSVNAKSGIAGKSPNSGTCKNAKSEYGIELKNQLETKKNRIVISADKGIFDVIIADYDEVYKNGKFDKKATAKQVFEEHRNDSPIDSIVDDNKAIVKEEEIGLKEFAVLVVNADDEEDALCEDYYYEVWFITLSDDDDSVNYGDVTSAYLDDIKNSTGNAKKDLEKNNYCGWAQVMYEENKNNDFGSAIKRTMISCFPDGNNKVEYNLSNGTLGKLAKKLDSFSTTYKKYLKSNANKTTLPDLPAGKPWVKINNTKNFTSQYTTDLKSNSSTMLTCDAKNEETYKYLYYIEKKNYKANYTGVEENVDPTVCSTECREQLVVSFGPPKAIIAGQCFTYEVEIRSKVDCTASLNLNGIPDITKYIPGAVFPKCNDITGYQDQAGPSEEFDICINECDGGEYSQSCIDKCYTKVYGKEKNNKNSKETKATKEDFEAYKETTITKVLASDSTDACKDLKPSSVTVDGVSAIIGKVYNYTQRKITGNFKKSGNTLTYKTRNSGCKWNNYAPYYFNTKAMTAKTVCNDYGFNWTISDPYKCQPLDQNRAHCSANNGCYRGKIGGAGYHAEDGFKKRVDCGEDCTFTRDTDKYYYDREKAEDDYVHNVTAFYDEAIGCINAAVEACKTDTSTYQMTVNYDQNANSQTCAIGDNNSNCKTWNATGNKSRVSNASDSSILVYNGGTCLGRTDTYMYNDVITFPGAWINNKNGKVTYEKPNNENWYTYKEGNYCSPLNAKNVNAPYWRWYQNTKSKQTTKSFEDWAGNSYVKSIVYNIGSSIVNFGQYNWKFDVGCFYAIGNDTETCPNGKCCPNGICQSCTNSACPGGKKIDTSVKNYTSKSYTSKDIFPNGTGAIKKIEPSMNKLAGTNSNSSASRAEGFNWTVNATNVSIKGYPVTPSALVKKIEGTETYTEAELDYDITLSTSNLRNIKREAGSSNNYYTEYNDGKYTVVKGTGYTNYKEGDIPSYTYYTSSFLRSNSYVSRTTKIPGVSGLPCNNIKDSNSCDLLTSYMSQDAELANWLSSIN